MARADAGFTLLEVVCVVAIVALIAGLALPGPHAGTSRAGVERLARDVASLFKRDRYAAIRQRAVVETRVNMRAREINAGSNRAALHFPDDVDIRATVTAGCGSAKDTASFEFYPDGRACGGELTLGRDGAIFQVRVDWLTGGVEIVAPPPV